MIDSILCEKFAVPYNGCKCRSLKRVKHISSYIQWGVRRPKLEHLGLNVRSDESQVKPLSQMGPGSLTRM